MYSKDWKSCLFVCHLALLFLFLPPPAKANRTFLSSWLVPQKLSSLQNNKLEAKTEDEARREVTELRGNHVPWNAVCRAVFLSSFCLFWQKRCALTSDVTWETKDFLKLIYTIKWTRLRGMSKCGSKQTNKSEVACDKKRSWWINHNVSRRRWRHCHSAPAHFYHFSTFIIKLEKKLIKRWWEWNELIYDSTTTTLSSSHSSFALSN